MAKVSVIVPNYNHARFLRQRLDSIFAQTYRDFEVIILDDASTDNSREVIAEYANRPNVRCVFNTLNSGDPFAQWRRGAREAQGEYVWIAESDDYAAPRFLETLLEKMEAYPRVGLAYAQTLLTDEHGVVTGSARALTDYIDAERWKTDYVNDGRDECGRYLSRACTVQNASAALFRRSAFMAAESTEDLWSVCVDYLTYMRLLLRFDIAYSALPLNYYRRHASSIYVSRDHEVFARQVYNTLLCMVDATDILEAVAPGSKARFAASILEWWTRYACLVKRNDLPSLEAELLDSLRMRLGWRPSRGALGNVYTDLFFARDRMGDYDSVRHYLPRAFWKNPSLLSNRGAWALALRAFLGISRPS